MYQRLPGQCLDVSAKADDLNLIAIATGAQFIAMLCGDIMTMPKVPGAIRLDIGERRKLVKLFWRRLA